MLFSSMKYLCDIVERCRQGLPLDEEAQKWLAGLLDDFLTRGFAAFEEALGIVQGRGGVPWWLELAIRRRDAALRELAHRFFGDLNLSAQAKSVYTLAIRYAASTWNADKSLNEVPRHYLGTPHEWLWHAFHSGARMPIGERQLRSVLL